MPVATRTSKPGMKVQFGEVEGNEAAATSNGSEERAASLYRFPSMCKTACTYPNCGKEFSNAGNMRRHVREVHSEEHEQRPYVCDEINCGKSFRQDSHLKKHKETHIEKIKTPRRSKGVGPAKQARKKKA